MLLNSVSSLGFLAAYLSVRNILLSLSAFSLEDVQCTVLYMHILTFNLQKPNYLLLIMSSWFIYYLMSIYLSLFVKFSLGPNPRKKLGDWDPVSRSWHLTYVESRIDSYTFIIGNGNPMPESTLTLCQSRHYSPVRDLGFGLCSLSVSVLRHLACPILSGVVPLISLCSTCQREKV